MGVSIIVFVTCMPVRIWILTNWNVWASRVSELFKAKKPTSEVTYRSKAARWVEEIHGGDADLRWIQKNATKTC